MRTRRSLASREEEKGHALPRLAVLDGSVECRSPHAALRSLSRLSTGWLSRPNEYLRIMTPFPSRPVAAPCECLSGWNREVEEEIERLAAGHFPDTLQLEVELHGGAAMGRRHFDVQPQKDSGEGGIDAGPEDPSSASTRLRRLVPLGRLGRR